MKISYSYPGMRLGIIVFVVQFAKVMKVLEKRQKNIRMGEWENNFHICNDRCVKRM